MADPRVSVIVSCYNLGQFLDEAVESVLAQTYTDFDILIVDDGSSDEQTRELLSTYQRPRTRVIRSENRGLPAAKNLGLANTAGPYVCMFDADDRLDPSFLQKSVAALDDNPGVAFVSHWVRTFGDEVRDWTPEHCDFPALLDMNTVNGAALVRRHALESAGGFDESMRDGCEDWDMWIALVERGFTGRILPEVLYHYRRRAESMSRVMMKSVGHPRLYRYIVEKHAASYAKHIGALVTRRERDMSSLRLHTHDLEIEDYRWLDPERAKWRDDVTMWERKVAEAESRRQAQAELDRLQAEVRELRASISWRVTAPLRSLYELIRRPTTTRPS